MNKSLRFGLAWTALILAVASTGHMMGNPVNVYTGAGLLIGGVAHLAKGLLDARRSGPSGEHEP